MICSSFENTLKTSSGLSSSHVEDTSSARL
jgi:hypothetical protein